MTEYSNESSYQNETTKISCHFKENGSKTGKVHLPLLFFDGRLFVLEIVFDILFHGWNIEIPAKP